MFVYITCDFWRCVQKQTPLVYSVMKPWKLGIISIFNAHILRWSLERPNWEAPCYFSLKGEWATILQLLVDNHQDMVQLFLIQYTFQITVYSIWRERNWRRHGDSFARLYWQVFRNIYNCSACILCRCRCRHHPPLLLRWCFDPFLFAAFQAPSIAFFMLSPAFKAASVAFFTPSFALSGT